MLTKEQILSKMQGFECPAYLRKSCWQPIHDQAVAAIDLAAENERLKNTLNSIEFLLQTQNDGADKTSMIRDLMAKHYRQGR